MSFENLNKLNAWREAKDFAVLIYKTILPKLPQDEKWGIGMQLRRASQSISTNIAEGFGRYYYQDMVRFSYIARGSLEETISLIALCYDLGFINLDDKQSVSLKSNQLLQIINGYIAYLKKSKQGDKEFSEIREDPAIYGDSLLVTGDDSPFSILDSQPSSQEDK
jgi:four helix bundle protein